VLELKNQEEIDIWKLYLFALKSPLTTEKYSKRIEKFFDFLGQEGKIPQKKKDYNLFKKLNWKEINGFSGPVNLRKNLWI
jgi:hypothetical protein